MQLDQEFKDQVDLMESLKMKDEQIAYLTHRISQLSDGTFHSLDNSDGAVRQNGMWWMVNCDAVTGF